MADHPTGAKPGEMLLHLLRGCKVCCEGLRPLVEPEPAGSGSEYDAPITRAIAAARTGKPLMRPGERARVEWGLGLLRSRPRGVHGLTDEEAEALRGAPMVEVLAQLSFEERYRDPEKMVHLALLAKLAAENLDPRDYDPRIVGLDLAAVWLEQGKVKPVKELAEGMLATFRKLGIQREALRAMDCLKRACEQEAATPDLARRVGRFLRRLEREPQLRFEAG